MHHLKFKLPPIQKIDLILLILQLAAFSSGVILDSISSLSMNNGNIGMIISYSICIVVKMVREIRKGNVFLLVKSQLSFLLVYVLTGFLIVFGYYLYINIDTPNSQIALQAAQICVFVICFSMVIQSELQSLPEFITYFIGQIVVLSWAISDTVTFIYLFDTLPDQEKSNQTDIAKDFSLLLMATYVALGLIILDMLLRGMEEKMKERKKKKVEEEKDLEMQLTQ